MYRRTRESSRSGNFFDYDNDGRTDLLVANGYILDNIHLFHDDVGCVESNLMFRNLGGGNGD